MTGIHVGSSFQTQFQWCRFGIIRDAQQADSQACVSKFTCEQKNGRNYAYFQLRCKFRQAKTYIRINIKEG